MSTDNKQCNKCGSKEHNTIDCPHGFFSNKCSHCGSTDHESSSCPHGIFSSKCGRCGSKEHSTSKCPHGFFSSKCKNCGSADHASSSCPHGVFSDHCGNCGSKNHSTAHCPQNKLPTGINGLIAVVIIIGLLLALFSTPFKIIDAEFASFEFKWLRNRDVWIFCFSVWMSVPFLFHILSRVFKNFNAAAEDRFSNPHLSIGFFTLFLSFFLGLFIEYRFQEQMIVFYLLFSLILLFLIYLIAKKSQSKLKITLLSCLWP